MTINLTTISIDTIIQAISILAATLTFVIAQAIEKKKDRKQANRESYQQLEFASIDLFRFEAENIDLIRPIWEEDREIPDKNTAEYIVLMNYVCQILNLFEMALKFRRDKTLLPEVFGTWVAWFQLLICSPGFREIWKDVRMDYLPELREIMDGGIRITQQETDEDRTKEQFYQLISSVIRYDVISYCVETRNDQEKEGLRNTKFNGKDIPRTDPIINLGQLACGWVHGPGELEKLTTLFLNNSRENYISHSEIQQGRAYDENTWSNDILAILTSEFDEAIQNELYKKSNIAASYYNNILVGFALVEFDSSPERAYAILSDIIVDENYRECRIGETLLNWIAAQLEIHGIKSVYAESNLKNSPAHRFLVNNGFKPLSKVFKKDLSDSLNTFKASGLKS